MSQEIAAWKFTREHAIVIFILKTIYFVLQNMLRSLYTSSSVVHIIKRYSKLTLCVELFDFYYESKTAFGCIVRGNMWWKKRTKILGEFIIISIYKRNNSLHRRNRTWWKRFMNFSCTIKLPAISEPFGYKSEYSLSLKMFFFFLICVMFNTYGKFWYLLM